MLVPTVEACASFWAARKLLQLSPEDSEMRERVAHTARAAAEREVSALAFKLLSVRDVEELAERLYDAVDSGAASRCGRAVAAAVAQDSSLEADRADPLDLQELVFLLGDEATTKIELALRLGALAMDERLTLVRASSPADVSDAFSLDAPRELGVCSMLAIRGLAASIALSVALGAERPLDRSQSLLLATAWVDGERAVLRLLASLPGSRIGEDLVPRTERFDAEGAEREHEAALTRSREVTPSTYDAATVARVADAVPRDERYGTDWKSELRDQEPTRGTA